MSTEKAPSISAQALRKIKKPIIERKRRERINDSLNQLKALVLDALNKDESRYSKMEKADILEMTVRHLKVVQRQAAAASSPRESSAFSGSELVSKYRAGYHECATEVSRYMASMRGVDTDTQSRLLRHLSQKLQTNPSEQQLPSPTATSISTLPGVNMSLNSAMSPSGVIAVVAPSSEMSNGSLLRDAIPLKSVWRPW
ncbi:hypothetical protein CAPTEDRAFT_156236 [Capitella teleta]|uniref:HES2 n=1 Tax=Capitella teleta TaxID=283909 RepID=R7V4W4_CAPTE|nr:hypothetical protein CAPTEDRAFT_156236 [Capitella teleta]|eukprot:ELU10815.1 hypothetical protein CAPTEDRAFT_156236 [Capitella teleta]